MFGHELIIKDTHRGLRYRDGKMVDVLQAGRYVIPWRINLGLVRTAKVEVVLVDVRERELTIKGQEILTADKVALRVSIVVQFRVVDPRAAIHEVSEYQDRLYSDVQLAARRSLAAMTLEEILTNRNRLSEDILRDVKETAARYGVTILRADVKDLIFPGNLQEIMNRVLAAERSSHATLIEARTKAEAQQIDARAKAEGARLENQARAEARFRAAEAEAEVLRTHVEAEGEAMAKREKTAAIYASHPALLRLKELETLRELAGSANARIFIGFDKHSDLARMTEQ